MEGLEKISLVLSDEFDIWYSSVKVHKYVNGYFKWWYYWTSDFKHKKDGGLCLFEIQCSNKISLIKLEFKISL